MISRQRFEFSITQWLKKTADKTDNKGEIISWKILIFHQTNDKRETEMKEELWED